MYSSRAVTLLVPISDDVINRILKLDIQTNILVSVTRCCTDLTSKVLKERTFGQSSAVLRLDNLTFKRGFGVWFFFRLPYNELIGGVLSFREDHFQKVNGYSNMYWGWGAEDDDMYRRYVN